MGFNYARERQRFENKWKKQREQYREAGFSEEGINAMRDFDEEVFRGQRRYENHSQVFPAEDFGEDGCDNKTNIFAKFGNLVATFDESSFQFRYAWIETVSDPGLASRLKRLKENDLELLTMLVIDGYNQSEAARLLHCSQKNISVKMTRIKKFIKNI